MRPLATSWPPELRTAAAKGAAQRFSKTSRAAEVPGSSALAASPMSSSSSSPEEAPSKAAKLDLVAEVGDLQRRDGAVLGLGDEGEVEDADQAAVDEVDQVRHRLAGRLASRPLDEQVIDRSHLTELIAGQADPPRRRIGAGEPGTGTIAARPRATGRRDDGDRPAVERRISGSPPIASTPFDPCHSTCMLLLQLRDLGRAGRGVGRLLGVVVLAAAQQRGGGGDEAGDDGEGEGGVEPVAEGARDQVREEGLPGQRGVGVGRQRRQRFGPDQVLDRVVAEEGGEEDRDRRRLRRRGGRPRARPRALPGRRSAPPAGWRRGRRSAG